MIPPHPPPTTPTRPFVFWVFFVVVPYKRASFQGSTLLQRQFSLIFTVVFNIRVVPLYTGASNIHSIQEHQTNILYRSIKHTLLQEHQTDILYRSIKQTFYTGVSNTHYYKSIKQTFYTGVSNTHYYKSIKQTFYTGASNIHSSFRHMHARTMVLPNGPARQPFAPLQYLV